MEQKILQALLVAMICAERKYPPADSEETYLLLTSMAIRKYKNDPLFQRTAHSAANLIHQAIREEKR
jgi:hypothetical protein